MDIQTKDGILLRGIPDGTPDEAIKARIAQIRAGQGGTQEGTQTAGWTPFTPSGERAGGVSDITTPEAIMGNPGTQFAIGAAEPVLGAAQAVGIPIDAQAIKDMSDKGAQLYGGNWTRVPARLAGNILSPVFLGIAKTLPASATLGDLVKAGMKMGAVGGATVLQDEPNLTDRGISTAIGAGVGAAVPVGMEGARAVGRGIGNMTDLFRGEQGANNILDRYLRRSIGPENVPAVAAKLRVGGAEPLPGYKPTAAEAVAGLPEGSPLVAHQRITASTPGGPSAAFGNRVLNQKAAIEAAKNARDADIVPLLKNEISRANANGIKSEQIVSGIDDQLATPGFRASDVVQKTLNAVKDKINALAKNGVLDGEDLWTVRKEIGNTVKTFSKETANWDKRLTSKLEGQIQKAIDQSIVDAGGTNWPKYMNEYAARSKAIGNVTDTVLSAARPAQRTDLFGGLRIAEETRAHVPQLLSRPMMAANAILRYFSSNIEPQIDKVAAQRYLNPLQFADALDRLPANVRSRVVDAMVKGGIAPAVQQAIRAAEQESAPLEQPQPQPAPLQPSSVRDSINSTMPAPGARRPIIQAPSSGVVRG